MWPIEFITNGACVRRKILMSYENVVSSWSQSIIFTDKSPMRKLQPERFFRSYRYWVKSISRKYAISSDIKKVINDDVSGRILLWKTAGICDWFICIGTTIIKTRLNPKYDFEFNLVLGIHVHRPSLKITSSTSWSVHRKALTSRSDQAQSRRKRDRLWISAKIVSRWKIQTVLDQRLRDRKKETRLLSCRNYRNPWMSQSTTTECVVNSCIAILRCHHWDKYFRAGRTFVYC